MAAITMNMSLSGNLSFSGEDASKKGEEKNKKPLMKRTTCGLTSSNTKQQCEIVNDHI